MKSRSQKDIFLDGEGDEWLKRNKRNLAIDSKNMKVNKEFLSYLLNLPIPNNKKIKILEIGCGEGTLLYHLSKQTKWSLFGIDPSKKAIKIAQELGINAKVGTAEKLPFIDKEFDLIIFGFCLYLCDTNDLFKIAYEANRVSKIESWISIIDFWSYDLKKIPYKHKEGLFSNKYDFSRMFNWHPSYVIFDHKLRDFSDFEYTDSENNWLSITTLRKLER